MNLAERLAEDVPNGAGDLKNPPACVPFEDIAEMGFQQVEGDKYSFRFRGKTLPYLREGPYLILQQE